MGLSTHYDKPELNPAYELTNLLSTVDKRMEIFIAGDFNSKVSQPVVDLFKKDGWKIPLVGATFQNKQIDYIIDKTYTINRTDKIWHTKRKQYIIKSDASDHNPLVDELIYTTYPFTF